MTRVTPAAFNAKAEASGYDTTKVFYHGTVAAKPFRTFRSGYGELGKSIYVTDRPDMASMGARAEGGRVLPVFLKKGPIYNPLDGVQELAARLVAKRPDLNPTRRDALERIKHVERHGDFNNLLKMAGYVALKISPARFPARSLCLIRPM